MRMRSFAVLVWCVALVSASGCETNNVSLYIAGNILPEAQESGCTVAPDGTLQVPNGILDLQELINSNTGEPLRRGYTVFPLYVNQLRPGRNPVGADPNGIHVTAAVVTLYDEGRRPLSLPGGLANPFTVATSTFVPSSDQSVGSVVAIPDAYRRALGGAEGTTIIVGVQPIAQTTGDTNVESEPWFWPVDICRGCLIECTSPSAGAGDNIVCTPGQDVPTPVQCPDDMGMTGMGM